MSYAARELKMSKYGPAFWDINGDVVSYKLINHKLHFFVVHKYVNVTNSYKFPTKVTQLKEGDYVFVNGIWALVISANENHIEAVNTLTHQIEKYYPPADEIGEEPEVLKLSWIDLGELFSGYDGLDILTLYDLLDHDRKGFVAYLTAKGVDIGQERFRPFLYANGISKSI